MQWFARLGLVFISFVALAIGILYWSEGRVARNVLSGDPLPDWAKPVPAFHAAKFAWAQQYFKGVEADPDEVRAAIESGLKGRPLYAPAWVLLAKWHLAHGQKEAASRYLNHAEALWPTRARHLWDVAMQWARLGEPGEVARVFRRYLVAAPGHVRRVLPTLARYYQTPETLLDAVLPQDYREGASKDHYLRQMIDYARAQKRVPLAMAAWRRLDGKRGGEGANAGSIRTLINFLIAQNAPAEAMQIWQTSLAGASGSEEQIFNGSFEEDLEQYGFGWIASPFEGGRVQRTSRESVAGSYSAEINLDGSENVNLAQPSQRVRVYPNTPYRLTGFWKGQGVTTRSSPFIELRTMGAKKNVSARSQSRRETWPWEAFSVEITTPAEAEFLVVRLRRHKTDALDKLIAGSVFLDDLRLSRLQ